MTWARMFEKMLRAADCSTVLKIAMVDTNLGLDSGVCAVD